MIHHGKPWGFVMAAPLPLRSDYDGAGLRALARRSKDADQTRRLLALASIYDGGSRSAAAKLGGVGLQIVRDWVVKFNARGPAGLIDRKAPGQPPKLNPAQRQTLAEKVARGPIPAVDGVVRWRLVDLVQWIHEEFAISLTETTVSRELRAMGFRKLTARPRHYAQNTPALEEFKKNSPPNWRWSAPRSRREPT
jgi:transposase